MTTLEKNSKVIRTKLRIVDLGIKLTITINIEKVKCNLILHNSSN
jgi:hypothetical protein